jgi:hypothetical protein
MVPWFASKEVCVVWWRVLFFGGLALVLGRFVWHASKALYLMRVRTALLDYHRAVREGGRSSREAWLRRRRLTVRSLLFESGYYDDAPSPREGGRATKLNVYALESLEHWLSEHPQGMARAREALDQAIRRYFRRALRSLNPLDGIGRLLFPHR